MNSKIFLITIVVVVAMLASLVSAGRYKDTAVCSQLSDAKFTRLECDTCCQGKQLRRSRKYSKSKKCVCVCDRKLENQPEACKKTSLKETLETKQAEEHEWSGDYKPVNNNELRL